MKLPWRQAGQFSAGGRPLAELEGAPSAQACPTLKRALDATFRHPSPRILDLGPFFGDTVIFLADRGARVSVEEFEPPPPTSPDDEAPRTEPIHVDHPDGEFDLILAWEWWDFVPKERAPEFGIELRRLLKDGGRLLLFSLNDSRPKSVASPLHRYRVVDEEQVFRTIVADSSRPRWFYPTREIERLLAPMSIQALHLHRNQMREFLANKP